MPAKAARMKLLEALQILQAPSSSEARPLRVFLACGFTPLHLQTFLTAHLRRHDPERPYSIETGLYGDCQGSLERIARTAPDAATVVLEWSDFDPRLGLRHLGGWTSRDIEDILATVRPRADRYHEALRRAADAAPLALCLPTLPLPPLFH